MRQASTFFNEEQRARIEQAVADAESKTAAEIVPAVVSASGRYDRAEDIVGLWLALVLMALVWSFWPARDDAPMWGFHWERFGLPAFVAVGLAGFVAGATLAARACWLRRLFTPRAQMRDEVETHARRVFFDDRIHHTEAAAGVLIYISLHERMAAILADHAAAEALGQPAIEALCERLTRGLGSDDPEAALTGVIRELGDRLAGPLPCTACDRDEIPNALVTLDFRF